MFGMIGVQASVERLRLMRESKATQVVERKNNILVLCFQSTAERLFFISSN